MSDPITFTTEAERLKAREQYVALSQMIDAARAGIRVVDSYYEHLFDHAFPPIRPPKMEPQVRWVSVDSHGIPFGWLYQHPVNDGSCDARFIRVRITELDEGEV